MGAEYHFVTPKTNTEWWLKKIKDNKIRDEKQKKALRKRWVASFLSFGNTKIPNCSQEKYLKL